MHDTKLSDHTNPAKYHAVESALDRLAGRSIDYISEEIHRRYSNENSLPGAVGRNQTREDLVCHVEFLIGALATGTHAFFSDYIVWLTTALRSRGVPVGVLDEALQMLEAFYSEALDPEPGRLVSDVISSGRRAILAAGSSWSVRNKGEDARHNEALVKYLVNGDIACARACAEEAWEISDDYIEFSTNLFQPALYEVGELWQMNRISVDQERLATAISRTLLADFYRRSSVPVPVSDRSALFSAVSGNSHGIGVQIVADAFRLEGWSVHSVQGGILMADLLDQIEKQKPDVIGLSVSLVEHLPKLRRTVGIIRGEFGARTPIILVGGLPTNRFDHAWRWVGADAWAPDAKQATRQVK